MKKTFKVIPYINKLNKNKRMYTKESITKMVEIFERKSAILTGVDYPEHGELSMTKFANEYSIEDLYVNSEILYADVVLLTENIKGLVNDLELVLRPLTIGTVDADSGEVEVVDLIGLYFVTNDAFVADK